MENYKMTLAYDGRRYKGYRKTKTSGDKSIQSKLETIVSKLYETDIEVVSAVNTDAGVHATCQVVHFKVPEGCMNAKRLFDYFEEFLPDDIITISVEAVDDRFHSRYLIKSLTYQYRLWKKDATRRPLFNRHYVNVMKEVIDVSKMQEGAQAFVGEHDFTAFATKSKANSVDKEIITLEIEETEDEIIIDITANGFLLSMERIIVGTLIQIGTGQRDIDSIEEAFRSKNNKDVGHKAMAHALSIVRIEY